LPGGPQNIAQASSPTVEARLLANRRSDQRDKRVGSVRMHVLSWNVRFVKHKSCEAEPFRSRSVNLITRRNSVSDQRGMSSYV